MNRREASCASPYDEGVAASYARLAERHVFAAPARELVARLALPAGARVLDVGCGTGAVAVEAARAVGAEGRVAALDSSLPMLRILRAKQERGCAAVLGAVPGLPFPDRRFDAVLSGFVLSHVADPGAALADMVRVLRPDRRLGVSAWASHSNPFAEAWQEVGRAFVRGEDFARALRELLPADERFSRAEDLTRALQEAGLTEVAVERREHLVLLRLAEFLELREFSLEGQLLQRMLDQETRTEWRRRVERELARRFGDRVEYSRPVLLATGRKPA